MRIFITGIAGFIGSNLAFQLDRSGHNVSGIDNFTSGNFKNLLGFKGDVIGADICDTSWQSAVDGNFDIIFHEAAITDTTVKDQKLMMQVNVEGFKNILNFAADRRVKKVIYASSAGVYGNLPCPMAETAIPAPENVYGFSKSIMDNVAKEFAQKHTDITVIGLRYFNVYGPGEYYKGHTASMIYQLYNQMKAGKKPRLFKHGEQERDFVYIKDVVAANISAMSGKISCVVNVGTGTPRNFNDIVKCLNKETKLGLSPEYIDNPYSFFQLKTQADMKGAREKIGFNPIFSLEDGIADYVKVLSA